MIVYFAKPSDGDGPIKIGCSKHPIKRLRQLESDTKVSLVLMADMDGGFPTEGLIHKGLARHRVVPDFIPTDRDYSCGSPSEWFSPHPDVFKFIERADASCRLSLAADKAEPDEWVKQIIDDLGGIPAVADATGASRSAVSNWRLAGRGIPWKHKPAIARLASSKAIDLPSGYWGANT